MEKISSLCHDFINGQSEQEIPKALAENIVNGVVHLVDIVELLGIYLTSTDITKRAQGTKLLSSILTHFHQYQLSTDEVQYLVVFYCDRLKDSAVITPHVLEGLLALVHHQQLNNEDVVNISRTIFRETHNQSLQQSSRKAVYTIFYAFLTNYTAAIKQISAEFVLGYIQAMDGEKDPRNLQLVFNSVPLIVKHLNLEVLTDDLFEVVSCYFPINFTPCPTDPNAVTKEELVQGLRNCLTATPKFAEFCLPLLLEKLSSDLQSAKLDSLHTLSVGVQTFGVSVIQPYIELIWYELKREIFQPVGDQVEEAALGVVTALSKTLTSPIYYSGNTNEGENVLGRLISIVKKDCQHHLCEPELKLMRPAANVVTSIAKGSSTASYLIADDIIPLLIQQMTQQSLASKKRIIVEVILQLIQAFKHFSHPETGSPLSRHTETLLPLLLSLLGEGLTPLTNITIVTIAAMINLQCLSSEEIRHCVDHFMKLSFEGDDMTIRHESIQSLGIISQLYPHLTMESVVPKLLSQLSSPDLSSDIALILIAAVSTHYDVIMISLPFLVQVFERLTKESFSESNFTLAILISEAINTIVSACTTQSETVHFIYETIVPNIIRICIQSSSQNETLLRDKVLCHLSSVLQHLTETLDEQYSKILVHQMTEIYVNGNITSIVPDHCTTFLPLQPSSPWQQTQLIDLLTSVLSAAYPQSLSEIGLSLLSNLSQFSVTCSHQPSCLSAAKGCCCLVNKLEDDSKFYLLVESITKDIWLVINDKTNDKDKRLLFLMLWLWITKGLVVRSHSLGKTLAQKLLLLFEDNIISRNASDSFYLLLTDTPNLLTSKGHAQIKLFHKQYFYSWCIPDLVSLFHSSISSLVKESTLRALSHTMQSVPKQVLLPDLPTLFPLLLESLHESVNEVGVATSSLEAIYSLIHEAPNVIGQHLSSLVNHLLTLAQTCPYMKVRMSSLQCIGALTTLSTHLIYPYQTQIIQGLAPCLDDKKRLVRKEAVLSRSEWYLLGSTQ